jgi:DNA-binding MarR family transcriptional regulator
MNNRLVVKTPTNRLVDTSMAILRLLLRNSSNVNSIIKQTSSDRSYVSKVIKTLQKEDIIEETKSSTHKQMKIKQLTRVGRELAETMDNVDRYNEWYNKLREKRKEIFDRPYFKYKEEKVIRRILRSKGWTEEEINSFDDCASGACLLDYASAGYIKDALLFKYASILQDNNLHTIGKAIFIKIIMDIISNQLTVLSDELEGEDPSPILRNIYQDGKGDSRTNMILYFPKKMAEYSVLNNSSINKEAKEVLRSIFSLFELGSDDIAKPIEKVRKDIEICEKSIKKTYEEEAANLHTRLGNLKQLLVFYEEVASRHI